MFCLNEPYCYIFSFISPEIPLFHGLLFTSLGLVLIPAIHAGVSLRSYKRISCEIDRLSTLPGSPLQKGSKYSAIDEDIWNELRAFERLQKIRVKVIDTSERISLLWGYFSNTLILSTGILQILSVEELRCLLAHELSHHRRRDNLLKGILLMCRNSLFPLPYVYTLFRWWREEIELMGDEHAAVMTGRPLDVASALIKIISPVTDYPTAPSFPKGGLDSGPYAIGFVLQRDESLLSERVERLVAIYDGRKRVDHGRPSILPSETGLLIGMVSLFPLSFSALWILNPTLVHCLLENLLTRG